MNVAFRVPAEPVHQHEQAIDKHVEQDVKLVVRSTRASKKGVWKSKKLVSGAQIQVGSQTLLERTRATTASVITEPEGGYTHHSTAAGTKWRGE